LRLGAGAGFSGDRIDPAQDLAERGALDVLVFECLAERTMALAELRRRADPATGFDPLLTERLAAVWPACREQGTTIVTNMGAANPLAAAEQACALARRLGLRGLRVAAVLGDDVMAWLRTHDAPLTDGAGTVHGLGPGWVSAHAYLGADALLPALQGGAQLVICGRVADPALFLAPLRAHFGWAGDDWSRLGAGTVVGHLLECAAQVSGGYLADPGRVDVPDLDAVGFPWAEVSADGRALIGKLPGTGGRLDRLSCTAQLLYEIEDPAAYRQPDVTADFSQVRLDEVGPDRVAVSGGDGRERPATLKVCLGVQEGVLADGQISYAGAGAVGRAQLAREVLIRRLARLGVPASDSRIDLIGLDACHGTASAAFREGQATPDEVRVRCAVRSRERSLAERALREVDALYLNGPAGGGGVSLSLRDVLGVRSAAVPREAAALRTVWMET
jgi:hypothetical protein